MDPAEGVMKNVRFVLTVSIMNIWKKKIVFPPACAPARQARGILVTLVIRI